MTNFVRTAIFSLFLLGICSGAPGFGFNNDYEQLMRSFGSMQPSFTLMDGFMDGNDLLSRFDEHFMNIPFKRRHDVFGMFGTMRTPWWEGENICVERKVLEEDEEQIPKNINIVTSGHSNVHMQINQCVEGGDYYECTNTVADEGHIKTLKVVYTCCHGFKRVLGEGCVENNLKPLEETIEDLGGKEFLNLLVENELDGLLRNTTIFVPNDEAIEDFQKDMEELNTFSEAENVVYNIDDGLVFRRKKRSVMIVYEPTETVDFKDIIAGHIVQGFVDTNDMRNDNALDSANSNNDPIKISIYPTRPQKTVMANCAKIVSKDNHATDGVVHVVDKVILPAKKTITDILASDLQFKTFMSALETNDLDRMLSGDDGHFTVFAPTDAAFEKLDEITREKVLGNGGCSKDIIESHILNTVVCSGIVDHRVKVSNILGKDMVLSRDEDGNVEVEGVKLMMRDEIATNGVIHVIEEVIIQDSVKSVLEHLKKKNSHTLLNLLEKSGLSQTLDSMSNLTFFFPSEQALSEIPKHIMDEIVKDGKKLEELLTHHVAVGKKGSCHFSNNQHMETYGGGKLRINLHKHFGHFHPVGTVQCARIVDLDQEVCGGRVHTIDRVLTPPKSNVIETLEQGHQQFAKLIEFSGIKDEFAGDLHTVFAPVDSAFEKLEESVKSKLFKDKEVAEAVVRNHIIGDATCCASIPRNTGIFAMSQRKYSHLGETISLRRSHGGHIFANDASIIGCDHMGTNGIVHSLDSLLLPANLQQKRTNSKKKIWIF